MSPSGGGNFSLHQTCNAWQAAWAGRLPGTFAQAPPLRASRYWSLGLLKGSGRQAAHRPCTGRRECSPRRSVYAGSLSTGSELHAVHARWGWQEREQWQPLHLTLLCGALPATPSAAQRVRAQRAARARASQAAETLAASVILIYTLRTRCS